MAIGMTYLDPSPGVDSHAPEVIAAARAQTAGVGDPREAAVRLFGFVRDGFRYSAFAPFQTLRDYEGASLLKRGHGFCTQKSALLVALCRASGIPARFHFADLVNHNLPGRLGEVLGSNVMIFHTYAEIRLEGHWFKATPSFEKSLCERMGWYTADFDGRGDAILKPTDLAGRPHIEYVKDRGTDAGLPLEAILDAWLAGYGPETLQRWEAAARLAEG
jgi:transglutaminase-like putative cysteine protease